MASIAGISWDRLEREGAVVYPCREEGAPGEPVVFTESFPRGPGLFAPVSYGDPDELPNEDYPFVLITGRQLEHWHTGAMTRRSRVLDSVEPDPTCSINPRDLRRLGIEPGGAVTLHTRRGSISVYGREDSSVAPGSVFMPFAYYEAAANVLTNPKLDPWGKIPEFKYCAVQLSAGGRPRPLVSFGGGQTENEPKGKEQELA